MAELKPYVAPVFAPLPFIAYTKHLTPSLVPTRDATEDAEYDAAALVAEFGSPLFVISEARLRDDYRKFFGTFSDTHIDTQIAYSVKTNYLPAVCAIMREEGAWAEVVSGMEFDLARSLGFPGSEIVFNGPHKTRDELEKALAAGAIVNIDNFDELALIEQIAAGLARPARVGIRFSFQHGAVAWTKFGFNDDNGDTEEALRRIAGNSHLRLELLHNHCGTFVLLHQIYAASAARLIGLAKRARDLGLTPTMADLGGGFPSTNMLRPEFDVPGGSTRSGDFWFPYADTICTQLHDARELFGGRPRLILEPGRAVVDACAQLLCTVVARKSMQGMNDAVIVDAGVNLVPTVCYYDHPVTRAAGASARQAGRHDVVDVFGPLCMQTDRLRHSAFLPHLEVGDILAITHVGAYCHTQSAQFIQLRPATVLVGPNGADVIRRRETWRDVFSLDRLPDRLRGDGCAF